MSKPRRSSYGYETPSAAQNENPACNVDGHGSVRTSIRALRVSKVKLSNSDGVSVEAPCRDFRAA